MKPAILEGGKIPNPGNGFFRIGLPNQSGSGSPPGFSSITISQSDPAVDMVGTLTFMSGAYSAALDLASDRFLALAAQVPFLDVMIDVADGSQFFIVLA